MEIKIPNFALYKPTKLIQKISEIDKKWSTIEIKEMSPLEIHRVIRNIINEGILEEKNICRVLNNLLEVESVLKKDYENINLESFIESFSKLVFTIKPTKNVNLVLQYIYTNILTYYKSEGIIEKLKIIAYYYLDYNKSIIEENKYKIILSDLLSSNKTIIQLLEEKLSSEFFIKKGEYREKDFNLDYAVKIDSELIQKIYKRFIENNWAKYIKNRNLTRILIELKNKYLNPNETISLYKNILRMYESSDIDSIQKEWFEDMQMKLGLVNSLGSDVVKEAWKDFTDSELKIYRKWLINGKLDDYFRKKVNEPERYLFWKKYLRYMKEVAYYNDIGQAIVIEMIGHTVVEFGEKNNAAHVYNRKDFTITYSERIRQSSQATSVKISKFKIKERALRVRKESESVGWTHSGNWQEKFRGRLFELGYR